MNEVGSTIAKPMSEMGLLEILGKYPLAYLPLYAIVIFLIAWFVSPVWSDIQRQSSGKELLTKDEKDAMQMMGIAMGFVAALIAPKLVDDVALKFAIVTLASMAGSDWMSIVMERAKKLFSKTGGGDSN